MKTLGEDVAEYINFQRQLNSREMDLFATVWKYGDRYFCLNGQLNGNGSVRIFNISPGRLFNPDAVFATKEDEDKRSKEQKLHDRVYKDDPRVGAIESSEIANCIPVYRPSLV